MSLKERIYLWLRWSEKYTKTDMVYLVSGSFLSLISQTSALIGALVLAIMISHYVPKTSYGEYKYILSIVAILSSFSLNGIGLAVFQSTAQGYDDSLEEGFWANLRWSFAIFIGALGLALYYLYAGNFSLASGILIGGCFAPFLASANLFSSFLAGKKNFVKQTLYSVCDTLIPIGLMIGTVLLTSNPVILVVVYFTSNTLAALYFYRRTKSLYPLTEKRSDSTMLTYSKHLSALGVLSGIADNIDQIFLFHFVGVSELAIYTFAKALPDQMRTPIKNIDAMIQARFVNRSSTEIEAGMRNKITWYLFSLIAVVILYFFSAPYIFAVLFPQYIEAVGYSQIYILWILSFAADPAASYLSSRKNLKAQYGITMVYSFCNIVLVLFGAIFWGIWGVIITKVVSRFIVAAVYYYYYQQIVSQERASITSETIST